LLLDEPMSALDKQIRQKTQIELTKILQQVGVTCIMVTHDQEEAMTMAHRLAVMTEGQIVQCGTPQEVYAFPSSRFVAGFIGSANLPTGTIVIDQPDRGAIACAALTRPLYARPWVSAAARTRCTSAMAPASRWAWKCTSPSGRNGWLCRARSRRATTTGRTAWSATWPGWAATRSTRCASIPARSSRPACPACNWPRST